MHPLGILGWFSLAAGQPHWFMYSPYMQPAAPLPPPPEPKTDLSPPYTNGEVRIVPFFVPTTRRHGILYPPDDITEPAP